MKVWVLEELLLKPSITIQGFTFFFWSFGRQREASLHHIPWEDFKSKTIEKSVHFNTSTTDNFYLINKTFDWQFADSIYLSALFSTEQNASYRNQGVDIFIKYYGQCNTRLQATYNSYGFFLKWYYFSDTQK